MEEREYPLPSGIWDTQDGDNLDELQHRSDEHSGFYELAKKGDRSSREDAHRLLGGKINIGDTVYFVAEHYYYVPDKAGAQMEYLPVEGTVTQFIAGGYKEAKVRSVIDGGVELFFFKVSDYGKRFYPSREEALAAAKRAADSYDRTWGGITHEKIRRPWEEEKQ